jgi:hypothetical protein
MLKLIILIAALLIGCTPVVAPAQTGAPRPTAPATIVPTATTVRLDYVGLRTRLLTPLGGLIVAMRGDTGVQYQVDAFEKVAHEIDPLIASDLSINGNRLHSAISNTRHAISTKDVSELESVRRLLLEIN